MAMLQSQASIKTQFAPLVMQLCYTLCVSVHCTLTEDVRSLFHMASLIEKVQTLISANLHSIVDRALEQNSVAVMDEYIRQSEKNLEALEDSAATVGGTVKTLKRKYEEFASAAEKLDRDIDTLILKGKDDLAAAAQLELNTKQQLAQEYYEQWQEQERQYQTMLDMRLKLEARLTSIRQEREHLRALIELTEAKKVTTKTIKSLDSLATVSDKEVSNLADAIRGRLDTEDARLEMATRNISEQIEEVVKSGEVERQLDERRKRLLGGSTGTSGAGSDSAAGNTSS
jgi:phage shock protein A